MGILDRIRSWKSIPFNKIDSLVTPSSSGIHITETVALGIPAVYACIRVLAESIASLPLITYERFENGDRDRARGFTLYRLLHDSPNPLMTSFELRELLVGHLCLRGNSYCYVERDQGEVVALWPLHPDRVIVEIGKTGISYKYNPADGAERTYSMEDVLHIRGLSSDGVIGYSPLTILSDCFGYAKAASTYSANFFKNGAAPSGILSTPGKLNEIVLKQLRDSWAAGYAGQGNHHKTAILDSDLKWQSIGINPADSQMIEALKLSVVEIARAFRVPLNLIMDYERSTYSNVTEQNRSFLTHTLAPWLTRIEQALERTLLTEGEKERYFIEHLTQDFLRADTRERFEAYKVAIEAGFLDIDEVRKLENLNSKS